METKTVQQNTSIVRVFRFSVFSRFVDPPSAFRISPIFPFWPGSDRRPPQGVFRAVAYILMYLLLSLLEKIYRPFEGPYPGPSPAQPSEPVASVRGSAPKGPGSKIVSFY